MICESSQDLPEEEQFCPPGTLRCLVQRMDRPVLVMELCAMCRVELLQHGYEVIEIPQKENRC